MSDELMVNGIKYLSHVNLAVNDDSGLIGKSNMDYILTKHTDAYNFSGRTIDYNHVTGKYTTDIQYTPEILIADYVHNAQVVYLREDIADDYLAALSDYPVLNDQSLNNVQEKWLEDFFYSHANKDLYKRAYEDLQDKLDGIDDEQLLICYKSSLEESKIDISYNVDSAYTDLDKIKKLFMIKIMDIPDNTPTIH